MANSGSIWWIIVEFACRILGVSTATVLCAVGVETVHQGEFTSLGIYLITSSIGIMMFELAYFLDSLLSVCLPCPPGWRFFALWGKMAHVGGFHKFLYYSIMSVVCFLHPVLVWHATIPGSLLLVTALFNFILSKKTKTKSCKWPLECNNNQGSVETSSSFQAVSSRQEDGPPPSDTDHCLGAGGGSDSITLGKETRPAPPHTDRRRSWKERIWFRAEEEPAEREMEEMEEYFEPDTTSDTAPMITD